MRGSAMTLDQFFRALEECREEAWVVRSDGRVRCRYPDRAPSALYLTCPVEAVALKRGASTYEARSYLAAAHYLGLAVGEALWVAEAADYPELNVDLRNRILEATGL